MRDTTKWQSLREFTEEKLRRVALPLGGIGTGTVSLGGKGDFRDWEIMNRPGKGFAPQYSFFCIRIKETGSNKTPIGKILEGPIDESEYEGAYGTRANHHGMPRFRNCSFSTTYPFAKVALSDAKFPVTVELSAFNPFIPTDIEMSSLPIAVVEYKVRNTSKETLEVSIAGNLQNFIGEDGSSTVVANAHHPFRDGFQELRNFNTFVTSENVTGILFDSHGVSKDSERYGTIALSLVDGQEVTHRTSWANLDRKSTRLNSSHEWISRMPSSA